MPILNFGSLNIDHVYRVDTFVLPGETKHTKSYAIHSGGKGTQPIHRGCQSWQPGVSCWHCRQGWRVFG